MRARIDGLSASSSASVMSDRPRSTSPCDQMTLPSARSAWARGSPRGDEARQRSSWGSGGGWIAREVLAVGELDLPPHQCRHVARWCQLNGELHELDDGSGSASGARRFRSAIQLRCDLLVGSRRREGEVSGALLRVSTSCRHVAVDLAAGRLRQRRVERRPEERMREIDQTVWQHLDNAGLLGRCQRNGVEDGGRWAGHHGNLRQQVARGLGQTPHPQQGDVSLVGWDWQGPSRLGWTDAVELPSYLESEKRIAPGRAVNPDQQPTRDGPAERADQNVVEGGDAQRPDLDATQPFPPQVRVHCCQRRRSAPRTLEADGGETTNRLSIRRRGSARRRERLPMPGPATAGRRPRTATDRAPPPQRRGARPSRFPRRVGRAPRRPVRRETSR